MSNPAVAVSEHDPALIALRDELYDGLAEHLTTLRTDLIPRVSGSTWALLLQGRDRNQRNKMLKDLSIPVPPNIKSVPQRAVSDLPRRLITASRGPAAVNYLMIPLIKHFGEHALQGTACTIDLFDAPTRAMVVVDMEAQDPALGVIAQWMLEHDPEAAGLLMPTDELQAVLARFTAAATQVVPTWPLLDATPFHSDDLDQVGPHSPIPPVSGRRERHPDAGRKETGVEGTTSADRSDTAPSGKRARKLLPTQKTPAGAPDAPAAPPPAPAPARATATPAAADIASSDNENDSGEDADLVADLVWHPVADATRSAVLSPAELAAVVAAAAEAAHRTLDLLTQGAAPEADDVTALNNARTALVATAHQLSAQSGQLVAARQDAIQAALAQISDSSADKTALQRLAQASGQTLAAVSAITAAADTVAALLTRWPPSTDDDRDAVALLVRLSGLIDLGNRADLTEQADEALYTELSYLIGTCPPALSSLMRQVIQRRVVLPADAQDHGRKASQPPVAPIDALDTAPPEDASDAEAGEADATASDVAATPATDTPVNAPDAGASAAPDADSDEAATTVSTEPGLTGEPVAAPSAPKDSPASGRPGPSSDLPSTSAVTPLTAPDAASTAPATPLAPAAAIPPATTPAPAPASTTSAPTSAAPAVAPTAQQAASAAGMSATASTPATTPRRDPKLASGDAPLTDLEQAACEQRAAQWLQEGHFALAAAALDPTRPGAAAAARLCAFAQGALGPNGPLEVALAATVTELDTSQLVDGATARLLTTAALLHASVVTGSAALGSCLHDLSDRLDTELHELTRTFGDNLRTGALSGRGLAALTTAVSHDSRIAKAAAEVSERRGQHRTNRLPRAGSVLARLRDNTTPEGRVERLADCLHAAATDNRSLAEETGKRVAELNKHQVLLELIADDDAATRPPASRVVDGTALDDMIAVLTDDLSAVSRWVAACQQLTTAASSDFGTSTASILREALATATPALTDVLSRFSGDSDPLIAAAAHAAGWLLTRTRDLLTEPPHLNGGEPDARDLLQLPLLAAPDLRWTPTGPATAEGPASSPVIARALLLAPASTPSAVELVRARMDADDFRSAEQLLLANAHDGSSTPLSEIEALLTEFDERRASRSQELTAQLDDMLAELTRSDLPPDDPSANDPQREDLTRRLQRAIAQLDHKDADLLVARDLLVQAGRHTETVLISNQHRLRALLATHVDNADVQENLPRLHRLIDDGELDLAADDLEHLLAQRPLIDADSNDELNQFIAHGITTLPTGLNDAIISAVTHGTTHAALHQVRLNEYRRNEVSRGLRSWYDLQALFGEVDASKTSQLRDLVTGALRLVGLDARGTNVDKLDNQKYAFARGRRFMELRDTTTSGSALIPQFGSHSHQRYRLLLVWNQPSVEQLDEWRTHDESNLPLIILYLGTLTMQDRLSLSRRWSDPTIRPTIVLDDAALLWTATHKGTFDTLMRITLPFGCAQPYSNEKRPRVAAEMFFGRDRERRLLEAIDGPTIMYGGRGLGKSALLSTIMHDAERRDSDDLKVIWLEVDGVQGIGDNSDLLWGELQQRLENLKIGLPKGMQKRNSKDWVHAAVREHCRVPGRRILLLLDEAEGFFGADAPTFGHVRSLYQLSSDTNLMCKVVFTGLHSVQHAYSAGNMPFSPNGALQISPLTAPAAYQLLTVPLGALGYTLDPAAAQRILLHCNYQPYLIQIVAFRLLNELLTARARAATLLLPPPWSIPTESVARILHDPGLREDIRRAFQITLELDRRTEVIANLLVLFTHDQPAGARMLDHDLFEECKQAWPIGFKDTSLSAFRELLNELAGLGLLASSHGDDGRALRNETVLRALGTREEAQRTLETIKTTPPDAKLRGRARVVQSDASHGPLTTSQVSELFRKGNRARVIVGSGLTRVDKACASLRENVPADATVPAPANTNAAFKTGLEEGALQGRRSLVLTDLAARNADPAKCSTAYGLACGDASMAGLPRKEGATRTAALIAGPPNLAWLRDLAADDSAADNVVVLERYDEATLPLRWRGDDRLADFLRGTNPQDVLHVTGGWPLLVELLAFEALSSRTHTPKAGPVWERMLKQHDDPEWCLTLLEHAGALPGACPELTDLLVCLVECDGSATVSDVTSATPLRGAVLDQVIRLGQWLSLVDVTDDRLQLAPLIEMAWRKGNPLAWHSPAGASEA